MLFLDHNSLFLDNIEKIKKILSKVLNTFENIMENGAFAGFLQKSKRCIFYTFKYVVFQRRQKALLWSKGHKFQNFMCRLK